MNQNNADPVQRYQELKQKASEHWDALINTSTPTIHIGMATCGLASGAEETKQTFEEVLEKENLEAVIHPVGCHGHCYAEPLVIVNVPESGYPPIMYQHVDKGKATMLVKSFIGDHNPCFEHIYGATEDSEMIPSLNMF